MGETHVIIFFMLVFLVLLLIGLYTKTLQEMQQTERSKCRNGNYKYGPNGCIDIKTMTKDPKKCICLQEQAFKLGEEIREAEEAIRIQEEQRERYKHEYVDPIQAEIDKAYREHFERTDVDPREQVPATFCDEDWEEMTKEEEPCPEYVERMRKARERNIFYDGT
jgi:hypothetical protein